MNDRRPGSPGNRTRLTGHLIDYFLFGKNAGFGSAEWDFLPPDGLTCVRPVDINLIFLICSL